MDTEITKKFTNGFDPTKSYHVTWWSTLLKVMEDVDGTRMIDLIKKNPMNIVFKDENIAEIVFIHFSLAMKYSKSVLDGTAWIPTKRG